MRFPLALDDRLLLASHGAEAEDGARRRRRDRPPVHALEGAQRLRLDVEGRAAGGPQDRQQPDKFQGSGVHGDLLPGGASGAAPFSGRLARPRRRSDGRTVFGRRSRGSEGFLLRRPPGAVKAAVNPPWDQRHKACSGGLRPTAVATVEDDSVRKAGNRYGELVFRARSHGRRVPGPPHDGQLGARPLQGRPRNDGVRSGEPAGHFGGRHDRRPEDLDRRAGPRRTLEERRLP